MLTNTDKKPNQGLSARQWSNRHVFESWNELGSVRAVTARCWALGPADRSLGQLENALQNLSAPFSLDKLFYCSHTVGFHLASWLMIGWEHVGYCYSFIQQRYCDWKCSRVIEHPRATPTKTWHTDDTQTGRRMCTQHERDDLDVV